CPPQLKDLVGTGKVRLAIFDNTANLLKGVAFCLQSSSHAPVNGDPAKVSTPGNTHALPIAFEAAGKDAPRLADGDGRTRVRSGDHAQHQGHILHCARHWPFHRNGEPSQLVGIVGHATWRWTKPHHIAEGSR